LNELLRAAVQAPTAIHEEPWVFAVVQNRELLERISTRAKAMWPKEAPARHDASSLPRASHFARMVADPDFNLFYDAGTLIVIGARPLGQFVTADCWLAAENLMLAACAAGLGTCVIGSAVAALNTLEIRSRLNFPADIRIVAPLVVGHPRGPMPQSSRHYPDVLFWA
jgi:nitroreductase